MTDSNSILSLLDNFTLTDPNDIARTIADDFRKRRIEKGFTRKQFAEKSGVAAPTLTRFEQKGLISLTNLIRLAIELGYTSEINSLFATPKYSTMDELQQIRRNTGKKKASGRPLPE